MACLDMEKTAEEKSIMQKAFILSAMNSLLFNNVWVKKQLLPLSSYEGLLPVVYNNFLHIYLNWTHCVVCEKSKIKEIKQCSILRKVFDICHSKPKKTPKL